VSEVEELQAHVRKFEAHLNDLELELHDQGWQLHEASQRAERLLPYVQHRSPCPYAPSRPGDVVQPQQCTCGLRDALAADQPAEAGGEVG